MAIVDPRKRTIGVRVSQDEYDLLERFCAAGGARSISDLARTAVLKFVNQAMRNKSPSGKSAPPTQLKEIELKMDQLLAELASVKATGKRRRTGATG